MRLVINGVWREGCGDDDKTEDGGDEGVGCRGNEEEGKSGNEK